MRIAKSYLVQMVLEFLKFECHNCIALLALFSDFFLNYQTEYLKYQIRNLRISCEPRATLPYCQLHEDAPPAAFCSPKNRVKYTLKTVANLKLFVAFQFFGDIVD
jgi:hypothetical protein